MPTENPGQTVVECGKAAGYIKMVGKKMYRVSKVLNNNAGTGKELTIKELTELEEGIRLSYEDFLNNPMRAER